mgnify:CR=1 FL=1
MSTMPSFATRPPGPKGPPPNRGTSVTPPSPEVVDKPITVGDFTEYDSYFKLFTEAMKYKLRVNKGKGFIGDVPPARLLAFLKKEVEELEEAMSRGNHAETMLESADVANFALGIMSSIMKGTVNGTGA